jgi:hypothetical protein
MLIDEKGRLFGKWNIIDIFLIALILFILFVAIKGCLMINEPEKKAIEAKIISDKEEEITEKVLKDVEPMLKETARLDAEAKEMTRLQNAWYEGYNFRVCIEKLKEELRKE